MRHRTMLYPEMETAEIMEIPAITETLEITAIPIIVEIAEIPAIHRMDSLQLLER